MSKCKCEGNNEISEVIPNFAAVGFEQEESLQSTSQDLTSYLGQDVLALDLKVCVSAALKDGKICFTLPIYGDFCITPPIKIPASGKISVCAQTCSKLFVPTGVKASIYINDDRNPAFSLTLMGLC